jgi:hypothetical protein
MTTYRLKVPFDFAAHFTGVAAHLRLTHNTKIVMLADGDDHHVMLIDLPDESWLETWGLVQYLVE